jgi:uncharacterized protein DUF3105
MGSVETRRRRGRRLTGPTGALAVLALGTGLALAACGGGGASSTTTAATFPDAAHSPRGRSVDYSQPPPPIASAVRRAARAAGCSVRSFPMEPVKLQPDGTYHVLGNPVYRVSLPPTSGLHYPVWADWGVYDRPVPFKFQVHNLEHGGIIVHIGRSVPATARAAIRRVWAAAPAYVLVTPEAFARFPIRGIVVTSWQRWMSCPRWAPRVGGAIAVYRDVYRGTGPEQVAAVDSGQDVPGLPRPAVPDPGARP